MECILQTATVTPAVNQVLYHVGMGADPRGLKSYLGAKGIVMQAYPVVITTCVRYLSPSFTISDCAPYILRLSRTDRPLGERRYAYVFYQAKHVILA